MTKRGCGLPYAGVLQDEGYDVEAVNSGEACLDRLGRKRYDVIILDVWLPGWTV